MALNSRISGMLSALLVINSRWVVHSSATTCPQAPKDVSVTLLIRGHNAAVVILAAAAISRTCSSKTTTSVPYTESSLHSSVPADCFPTASHDLSQLYE